MEGEGGSVVGPSHSVSQCDPPSSDGSNKLCRRNTRFGGGVGCSEIGSGRNKGLIVAMQQERLAGDVVDPSGSTPAETKRQRRDRPRKLNYQPWPIVN